MSSISIKSSSSESTENPENLPKIVSSTYYVNRKGKQMHSTTFKEINDRKSLRDFTFIVDGIELPVHRVVLSISSTKFREKFEQDRESKSMNIMEIKDIAALSAVVEYLYTSEIVITEDNVGGVMTAASEFDLSDLVNACMRFLKEKLTIKNCVTFGTIASQFKCDEVTAVVNDYIKNYFEQTAEHGEFLNLCYEQIEALISADAICVTQETVLKCILKWVGNDLPHRGNRIHSLMKFVRFSSIPLKQTIKMLREEEWFKSVPEYYSILGEIFECYFRGETWTLSGLITTPWFNPRQPSKLLIVAGIAEDGCLSIEIYDFEKKIWLNFPTEIQNIRRGPVIVGSKIYCFGETLTSIDFSNPNQIPWSNCRIKLQHEDIKHMIGLNGAIYIIRTKQSEPPKSILEMLDLSSFQYTPLADPPELDFVMTGDDGNIYGYGHKGRVYCYIRAKNEWKYLEITVPMHSSATVAGNTLYVVGDKTPSTSARAYNLVDSSEKNLNTMNRCRYLPGMIGVQDEVYVVGGIGNSLLDTAEVYDIQSDKWTMLLPKMNSPKRSIVAAIIDKPK